MTIIGSFWKSYVDRVCYQLGRRALRLEIIALGVTGAALNLLEHDYLVRSLRTFVHQVAGKLTAQVVRTAGLDLEAMRE